MALINFMLYYYKPLVFNNFIYSIDMLRFNFELNESIIEVNEKFYDFLHEFSKTQFCDLNTYFNKSYGYRYLYKFNIDSSEQKCSFSIGIQLGSKTENKNKGFIEFNPNKCLMSQIFLEIYHKFIDLCYSFTLVRYDVAIDIPCSRDKIKMIRKGNMNYSYQYFENNGIYCNSSITEYCGRRNHNKFTKLYDKKAESNLNYDLTRIEFTFDKDFEAFETLPKFLYLNNIKNDLSSNNLVMFYLLLESEDINYYLKLLSYRKRKSIEDFLNNYYLNINLDSLHKLRNYALSYEF